MDKKRRRMSKKEEDYPVYEKEWSNVEVHWESVLSLIHILDEKIEQLQSAIATESQNTADAEKWIALMKECVNPTEPVSYTHL